MDLWNWGLTARQTEVAEAGLRQQEYLAAQMEDVVSLEVNRAALDQAQLKASASLLRLARNIP